jgi:hypothetical protein
MKGRQPIRIIAGIICRPHGSRNEALLEIKDVPYETKYMIRICTGLVDLVVARGAEK